MATFYIVDIYEQIKNIDHLYFELTKEKRRDSHLHIIPKGDWESGYLWWNKNCWKGQGLFNPFHVYYTIDDIVYSTFGYLQESFKFCIRIKADEYPKEVIEYYTKRIRLTSPTYIYVRTPIKEIII